MAKTLFRSISDALSEQFPLLPRIRRSFWGLLLFCILLSSIGFSDSSGIAVPVKPKEGSAFFQQKTIGYENAELQTGGLLLINHPNWIERLLLPDSNTQADLLSLLFIAIASILIIVMVGKLQQPALFRKNISQLIRFLAWLVMLHGIISIYRNHAYLPARIETYTHQQFTASVAFPIMIWLELYISLIIFSLASLYEKSIQLQKEQDLTI